MRVQLVFRAWLDENGEIIKPKQAGDTYNARIELHEDDAADLRAALAKGIRPVFYAVAVGPDDWRAEADASLSA